MIVVYTDYNSVADMLGSIAKSFLNIAAPKVSLVLGPPSDSVSTNIHRHLASSGEPLFFFGHGEANLSALIAQDQKAVIDQTNDHLLTDRLVYAACCDGIPILLNAVNVHNATVVGFTDKLMVSNNKRYYKLLEYCILQGAKALANGDTTDVAQQKLRKAFRSVARKLMINNNRVEDFVTGMKVFNVNAKRVSVAGDRTRTI